MMHKANGSARRNYTPSTYHVRGGKLNPEAKPISRTKICPRCNLGIFSENGTTGTRQIHEHCKTDDDRRRADRRKNPGTYQVRYGRKKVSPLDPDKPRPQPLLVVSRPLTLAEVMHQYVASVLVECKGNRTAARRTLDISIGGLNRCIERIENGTVRKCQAHARISRNTNRKSG